MTRTALLGVTRRFAQALGDVVRDGLCARSYSTGVERGAYYVAVACDPRRVNELMDLAAAWAIDDGVVPTLPKYRPRPPTPTVHIRRFPDTGGSLCGVQGVTFVWPFERPDAECPTCIAVWETLTPTEQQEGT